MTDKYETEKPLITLRITGPASHKLTTAVDASSTTVGDLKLLVEESSSEPASYLRLISRGKKLDDDTVTLASCGMEDRTSLMCMHNERFRIDQDGIQAIQKLMDEIKALDESLAETPPHVVHELVTQICCKLDLVETHGSDALRKLRKQALAKAEALDPRDQAGQQLQEDVVE